MPTLVSKTVKSSGGDYSSLSAWEAGQQGDLPALDEIHEAVCYAFTDTTTVTIDGWTTDATRYINVKVAAGNRHPGYRDATKYKLTKQIWCQEEYARFNGLQMSATNGRGFFLYALDGGLTSDIRLIDCLIYDCTGDGVFCYSGTVTCINCVSMGNTGHGFKIHANPVALNCSNCVSINNTGSGAGFIVTQSAGTTFICKNCYAGGNAGADYDNAVGASFTITTSYSEDGSLSTPTAAFSTSSGAYFTNVTSGSENLHIGASSALKDAGTSLAGWSHPDGNVDIDGDARSGSWDVGADEISSHLRSFLTNNRLSVLRI